MTEVADPPSETTVASRSWVKGGARWKVSLLDAVDGLMDRDLMGAENVGGG